MKQFIAWFVTSSQDPRKYSLAIKGFIVMLAPVAMALLQIPEESVNTVGELVSNIVFYGLSLVSAVMALWGIVRKITNGRWSAW